MKYKLVIVVLRGTPGVKLDEETPRPRDTESLLKLEVVPQRMATLYDFPCSPGSWYFYLGQEVISVFDPLGDFAGQVEHLD